MITHTTYECEVCHTHYTTAEAAQECERQPMPPCPLVVGRRYRNRWLGWTGRVVELHPFDHKWTVHIDRDDDTPTLCNVGSSDFWEEIGE